MVKVKSTFGLAAVILAAACEPMETGRSEYPSAQAAISAGAIERGWVPEFLPSSAREISEKHNLDTNEVWLRFSVDPNERSSIDMSCRKISGSDAVLPRKGAGEWWPEALTEQKGRASLQAGAYTLYRCENGGSMAMESDGHMVFYWRRE